MASMINPNQLDLNAIYSYTDYLTWDFWERCEITKGKVHSLPGSNTLHQSVSGKLCVMMYDVIKKLRGQAFNAPLDVCLFNPMIVPQSDNHVFTVVQPDIMVFIDKNKVKERGGFSTPEFIIEILSPGNAKHELKIKKDLYEEYGVLEYLIVDPLRETIIQYVFNETKFSSPAIYLGNDKL